MKPFIRFKTSGGLDKRALTLLADYGSANVSNATKLTDGVLVVHSQTALAFVGAGYAERVEEGIEITPAGCERAEQFNESSPARKRRKMREDLEAQKAGKWKPTPAGYSATAQGAEADARQDLAHAQYLVACAHDQINYTRRMIGLAREWGNPSEVRDWGADLAEAELELKAAIRKRDVLLRHQAKRAA